jgi:hypothetical protein
MDNEELDIDDGSRSCEEGSSSNPNLYQMGAENSGQFVGAQPEFYNQQFAQPVFNSQQMMHEETKDGQDKMPS